MIALMGFFRNFFGNNYAGAALDFLAGQINNLQISNSAAPAKTQNPHNFLFLLKSLDARQHFWGFILQKFASGPFDGEPARLVYRPRFAFWQKIREHERGGVFLADRFFWAYGSFQKDLNL